MRLVSRDGAGAQNDQPGATGERGGHSAPPQGGPNASSFARQSPGPAAGGRRLELAVSFWMALRTKTALVPLMVSWA